MTAQAVSRELPYKPEQLFDLVADVEQYPEFVPHWVAARVKRVNDQLYYTDQVIELKPIQLRFRSRTVLMRPHRIEVSSSEKPFRAMQLHWDFKGVESDRCAVRLLVEFDVQSKTVQRLLRLVSNDMAQRLMAAFEDRARELYGTSRLAAPRSGARPFTLAGGLRAEGLGS